MDRRPPTALCRRPSPGWAAVLTRALGAWALALPAWAHSPAPAEASGWQTGAVLDFSATDRPLALGVRPQGLGLGHSDIFARGPLGQHWSAELIGGFHTGEGRLERHLENAWVQSRSLPAGLQLRAGRFASQVGYLNEQHPHNDPFAERPLLYRALLGGHWYDDGLRLNWTAPTRTYLRLGAEVFSGRKLVPHTEAGRQSPVGTLNLKTGGDWGAHSSWQWGLTRLHNPRVAEVEGHDSAHDEHGHAARFTGRDMWVSDVVWKWAPQGNNRQQQVTLAWEVAQVQRVHPLAAAGGQHRASSLSLLWRFRPGWETGVRTDDLRVLAAERDVNDALHFAAGQLREQAWMLAYKPNHRHTWRLQLAQQSARGTHDDGAPIFAQPARRSLLLQYVIALGAHGAHPY